jgi:DNA-3-methyladenine glycosylase I
MTAGLVSDEDGIVRCSWAGDDPLYRTYHDREWGMPVREDQRLFEKICLEGFQAGLAWITILRKRDAFRQVFRDFDIRAVARMNRRSVDRLLRDPRIVRHRGKIESTLNNARQAQKLIESHGSLARYFWAFEPEAADRPSRITVRSLRAMTQTPGSEALARDLKARGWSFVGPTTSYAFMQAMGLVNDHLEGCVARPRVETARQRFRRPSASRGRRTGPAAVAGRALH